MTSASLPHRNRRVQYHPYFLYVIRRSVRPELEMTPQSVRGWERCTEIVAFKTWPLWRPRRKMVATDEGRIPYPSICKQLFKNSQERACIVNTLELLSRPGLSWVVTRARRAIRCHHNYSRKPLILDTSVCGAGRTRIIFCWHYSPPWNLASSTTDIGTGRFKYYIGQIIRQCIFIDNLTINLIVVLWSRLATGSFPHSKTDILRYFITQQHTTNNLIFTGFSFRKNAIQWYFMFLLWSQFCRLLCEFIFTLWFHGRSTCTNGFICFFADYLMTLSQ